MRLNKYLLIDNRQPSILAKHNWLFKTLEIRSKKKTMDIKKL